METQTVLYSLVITATITGWRCSAPLVVAVLALLTNQPIGTLPNSVWCRAFVPFVFCFCLAEIVLDKYANLTRYRDLFAMFCAPALSALWCAIVSGKIISLALPTVFIVAISCAVISLLTNVGQVLVRTWIAGFASAHPRSTHLCLSLWTDALAVMLGVIGYYAPKLGGLIAIIAISGSAWAWWRFYRQGFKLIPWLRYRAQGCKVVELGDICRNI